MREIKTVTVIGANGAMGRQVAGIFASFGNARVYLVCRDKKKSEDAIPMIVQSVRAQSIARNLTAADYEMLEDCVAQSDLVFESVREDLDTKLAINKRVGKVLLPGAIFGSGSSGLSIEALSKALPDAVRPQYMGIHMYNPPYNMRLCELIATSVTDGEEMRKVHEYLEKTLRRAVVPTKDKPAFVGNRLGFQFLNTALQKAEEYKESGGIDYIDAIFGPFTGRSMPPLVTSDFVGLDVHKAIVDNLHANTQDALHDSFVFPAFAQKLVREGKLGRKAGEGLYKKDTGKDGPPRRMVYDVVHGAYREVLPYAFPFALEMSESIRTGNYKDAFTVLAENHSQEARLCLELLLTYVLYALYLSREVAFTVADVDTVMAEGFNWCPPMALRDALAGVADFDKLVKTRLPAQLLQGLDADALLALAQPSQYDYRPYFKSSGKAK